MTPHITSPLTCAVFAFIVVVGVVVGIVEIALDIAGRRNR